MISVNAHCNYAIIHVYIIIGGILMPVEEGKLAPDFTLQDQDGNDVTLSDYRGKNVILYFYPRDMTPGCTTQACDFRDNIAAFVDENTVVLGVSPDPIEKHQKFIAKYDLPFPLLADTENKVSELYGVWKLKNMFGKKFHGVERSTFVIDKEGIVQKAARKVRVKEHVNEMLDFVKQLTE